MHYDLHLSFSVFLRINLLDSCFELSDPNLHQFVENPVFGSWNKTNLLAFKINRNSSRIPLIIFFKCEFYFFPDFW